MRVMTNSSFALALMNELVERCEKFLEASKLRYPLEQESPAVMMKVALEASDLNLTSLS